LDVRGLVHTCSYADVLKAGKVDEAMSTDAEPEDVRGREVTGSEGDAEAKTDTNTNALLCWHCQKRKRGLR
jgi:hypothetical protein